MVAANTHLLFCIELYRAQMKRGRLLPPRAPKHREVMGPPGDEEADERAGRQEISGAHVQVRDGIDGLRGERLSSQTHRVDHELDGDRGGGREEVSEPGPSVG